MRKIHYLIHDNFRLAVILLAAGAIPLIAAYISQYGFGFTPCELCIMQRVPFFVVMALAILLIFSRNLPVAAFYVLGLAIIAFLANAGIAFFHMGVEFKWWTHGDCTASLNNESFEAFKASVMNAARVRCDEPQFKFIGVSMAGWNFVLNLFYVLFFCSILKAKVQNGKNDG